MKQPPALLRAYIAAIGVAAIAVVGALVVVAPAGLGARDLLIAAQLVVLVALARCYPVHLAPKTKLSLDTAPTLAALILLPAPAAVLSVAAGMLAGELWQRAPSFQVRFNTSVAALRTATGAAIYAVVAGGAGAMPGAREVLALAMALVAMIAVAALLVDVAAGLAMGRPLSLHQVWLRHSAGFGHEAALALLGLFAAYVASDLPWVLALMAVPGALIYVSLRDGVALRRRTMTTLAQLADLAEGSPGGGAAHGERVADLCRALARRLGLGETETETLAAAGRLHQLAALNAAPDTPDGAVLAAQLLGGEAAAAIIRQQHARWDGGGAAGAGGARIPTGARIIAVADAYDHLTGHTAPGIEPLFALAALQAERGRRFDPAVLDALAALVAPEPAASPAPAFSPAEAAI